MNAIKLCKQLEIENISGLFDYIITNDHYINVCKKDIKLNLNFSKINELERLGHEVRLLQGHLNSIISKREKLRGIFNIVVADRLSNDLLLKTFSSTRDIEYGLIEVECKMGGFNLKSKTHNGFYDSVYRDTKLFKTIKC